ncbi:MAG: hypothetical protein BYD32DRAFT_437469 [Podila humilis]|nr:MAG: hypothetical protein BYD32DRAFT_437469 [Podila humilis]
MASHSANPNTPQGTKRRRRKSDDPTPLPLRPQNLNQVDVTHFDYPIHPHFKNDISLFGDLRSFFAASLLHADQEHLDLAYAMNVHQLHANFVISSGLLAMDVEGQSATVREAALAALEVGGPYSNFAAVHNAWLQGVDSPNIDAATAGTEQGVDIPNTDPATAGTEQGVDIPNTDPATAGTEQGVNIPNTDPATAGTEPSSGLLQVLADAITTAVSAIEAANNNNNNDSTVQPGQTPLTPIDLTDLEDDE